MKSIFEIKSEKLDIINQLARLITITKADARKQIELYKKLEALNQEMLKLLEEV